MLSLVNVNTIYHEYFIYLLVLLIICNIDNIINIYYLRVIIIITSNQTPVIMYIRGYYLVKY